MLTYSLLLYFTIMKLSSSEVYRTLDEDDLSIANYCMDNKHPYKPSTFSCEEYHQNHVSSQLSSISQILKKTDAGYIPSKGLYPIFPAISSGIFGLHSIYPLNTSYLIINMLKYPNKILF